MKTDPDKYNYFDEVISARNTHNITHDSNTVDNPQPIREWNVLESKGDEMSNEFKMSNAELQTAIDKTYAYLTQSHENIYSKMTELYDSKEDALAAESYQPDPYNEIIAKLFEILSALLQEQVDRATFSSGDK